MNQNFSKLIFLASFMLISLNGFSQEENDNKNLQSYTPSKLLDKNQWDIKFFNNLYTQTKSANSDGKISDGDRSNFFTSTVDVFVGVSENNRINVGLLTEFRSNTINDSKALSVFSFKNDEDSRVGFSSFAPAIKFQPLKNIGNFSIQSAFHIPVNAEETNKDTVFLDQTAYMFQNRFFYDYTFSGGDWQIFTELSTEYNFGDDESFANNTYVLAPGVFLSHFPTNKITLLGFLQHYQRFGDFTQDFSSAGLGGKYQLSQKLNLEVLYSKFIRGTDSGIGQSFNLGLRILI